MDPTATLRMIRELITEYDELQHWEYYDQDTEAVLDRQSSLLFRLASLIEDLDRWLRRGGCLPVEWNHAITSEHAQLIKERDDLESQNRELLDQVQCLQWDLGALQAQHDHCPQPATRGRR
ncbi:hypothetical protein [Nocardia sp. CC201C]|uniref:hypothetical protein n=1 Tax=Nocardia sp. CC201C TaxID=3044575 RepID=UPI0024A9117F|nr:hypothetical protein [Nocardia sp. CC201C]